MAVGEASWDRPARAPPRAGLTASASRSHCRGPLPCAAPYGCDVVTPPEPFTSHYTSHVDSEQAAMTATMPTPLGGPPPAEIHLPGAPLVRVIAQVRFPPILAIGDPGAVAP